MGIVVVLATLVAIFQQASGRIPAWFRLPVHLVFPLTNLLSEERFLAITRASLKPYPWTNHLTALTYGLNYAFVWFLMAVLLFQYRSLSRD
jgi:hypothetical protein